MLPSVTQIISSMSPFPAEVRQKWIDSVNLELTAIGKETMTVEDLMDATCIAGDIVHTYFINRVMGYPQGNMPERFSPYQIAIDEFIALHDVRGLAAEFLIEKPDEYIGHPDLICMVDGVKSLCDIKTYLLYRHILGLGPKVLAEGKKPPKLAGHTSSVSLQTSLYKDALIYSRPEHWDVEKLYCFHVKEDTIDCVELKYGNIEYLKWLHGPKPIVDVRDSFFINL